MISNLWRESAQSESAKSEYSQIIEDIQKESIEKVVTVSALLPQLDSSQGKIERCRKDYELIGDVIRTIMNNKLVDLGIEVPQRSQSQS